MEIVTALSHEKLRYQNGFVASSEAGGTRCFRGYCRAIALRPTGRGLREVEPFSTARRTRKFTLRCCETLGGRLQGQPSSHKALRVTKRCGTRRQKYRHRPPAVHSETGLQVTTAAVEKPPCQGHRSNTFCGTRNSPRLSSKNNGGRGVM